MDLVKNNHNYTLFKKILKLYMVLAYTFFKPYIFKICNGFSYIGSVWIELIVVETEN